MNAKKIFFSSLLIFSTIFAAKAQNSLKPQDVDKIIGIVGKGIVLQSEVETQYLQLVAQSASVTPTTRCKIFEDLLYQKLLLNQAEKDSLTVSDEQVDAELTKRMDYYISQFGSQEKFEAFYGKSVDEYKADLKDKIRDLLLEQQQQSKITADISVSPLDVRDYFNTIPKDSIPFINAQVEIGQIVKKPNITSAEKKVAFDKITELRKRVLSGEDFSTLAVLYSDDPGSSKNGGEYKNIQRGQFVPEFDAVTFNLKEGEISPVFETQYGYHFVQLIKRRGEFVDLRHILIAPKVDPDDMLKAKLYLDSIKKIITKDSLPFSEAAMRYSDDDDSKNDGGLIMNMQTGSTKYDMDQLGQVDPNLVFSIDKMQPGDISDPEPMATKDAKQAYRILYLKTRTKPHKANLQDDYQAIQNQALSVKQHKTINNWIKSKLTDTYVHIDEDYLDCKFDNPWKNTTIADK
ncbi:MAG: peptidylprolyl isomerase [Bacteroidia bacterium]